MAKNGQNDEEVGQAVSPSTQALSTSLLSLCINIILEFEAPIQDISHSKQMLMDALMPKNPRFSCILEEDEKGVARWRKTKVNVDDHLFTPNFEPGHELYDEEVSEYVSNLCLKPFDTSRPLWEFHVLNCKTSIAESTVIIKVHHAVGDGVSLMSALFSCVTRVDNPALPPSFPTSKKPNTNVKAKGFTGSHEWSRRNWVEKVWYVILVMWYTIEDVMNCLLRMMGWLEDSKMPIRGPPGVEFLPVAISSVEFPLEDIRQIKASIGGTVNDVLTGIILLGLQRYLQICLSATGGEKTLQDAYKQRFKPNDIIIKQMKKLRMTTLSLINKRILKGLEHPEEMVKPDAQIPWGNHFGFLYLKVPLEATNNPLDFVKKARSIIDRKKMSLGIIFITKILGVLGRSKGSKVLAKSVYNTIKSTTLAISNMIGPTEKIAIDNNIVKRFSFFVSGAPQAFSIHILSYMDNITIQVIAQKDYVNANILSKLFIEALKEIKEASIHNV